MQMPSDEPPAPAGPLPGRGLRDRLDRQPLHLRPPAVARDSRRARVDDVVDAGHGQRGLGDVGGEHDAAAGVRLEHLLLLGGRQPRVQRQHLGVAQLLAAQRVGGVADLALAGQEHQHVARLLAVELADRVDDRLGLVAHHAPVHDVVVGVVGIVARRRRTVRVRAAGSGSRPGRCGRDTSTIGASPKCAPNRCGSIVADVTISFRSGRRGSSSGEVAEQEVDVQAALVRLVQDERVVAAQHAGRAGSRRAGCRRSSA